MTRNVLSALLCALTLGVGLATALVASGNRAEAFALDELRTECRMLEAVNSANFADVLALDWGHGAGREPGGAGDELEEGVQ